MIPGRFRPFLAAVIGTAILSGCASTSRGTLPGAVPRDSLGEPILTPQTRQNGS